MEESYTTEVNESDRDCLTGLTKFIGVYLLDDILNGNLLEFYKNGYGMTNEEALAQWYCFRKLTIVMEGSLFLVKNNMGIILPYFLNKEVDDSLMFNEDCRVVFQRVESRLSVIRLGDDQKNRQVIHFTFRSSEESESQLLVEMAKGLKHELILVYKRITTGVPPPDVFFNHS